MHYGCLILSGGGHVLQALSAVMFPEDGFWCCQPNYFPFDAVHVDFMLKAA